MTLRINTDVIRNTSKEKFSAKKNHQISTIVCWYNDQLSAINKYIYLFNCRFLQEKWLDWSFLNQEEFPGNHQIDVSTGICRKPQTYKLWLLPAYDMPSPWYLYNIICITNLKDICITQPGSIAQYYIIDWIKMLKIPIRLIEIHPGWV